VQPANTPVRTVVIYFIRKGGDIGRMTGIQFYDKNNVSILKAGYWPNDLNCEEHRIELKEGERIIGVKSGGRGADTAHHYDV
jgi:hypothetical protein